jgi:hypothetical protein
VSRLELAASDPNGSSLSPREPFGPILANDKRSLEIALVLFHKIPLSQQKKSLSITSRMA